MNCISSESMKKGEIKMRIRDLALVSALALLAVACETTPSATDDSAMRAAGQGLDAQGYPLGSQEDLAVTAGDRVFYCFNCYNLTAEALGTIDKQAQWLNTYPNTTITISGHCDERGTVDYNIGLGMRRATAHKNALVERGIAADRVATISYGKEYPLVEGHTEEVYAQNRVSLVTLN